jgi:hypothetical protein
VLQDAAVRRAQLRDVRADEDGDDPGALARGGELETRDARVRVDATHEHGVDHPRQRDVVDVMAAAGENARVVGTLEWRADVRHGRSLARGLRVD